MIKAKDFYGKDIPDVIEQACKAFACSQGALNIEVLDTGSTGIFGLCRKKAHIRARRKTEHAPEMVGEAAKEAREEATKEQPASQESAREPASKERRGRSRGRGGKAAPSRLEPEESGITKTDGTAVKDCKVAEPLPAQEEMDRPSAVPSAPVEEMGESAWEQNEADEAEEETLAFAPSVEDLAVIRETLAEFLTLMEMPSQVEVAFERNTIHCAIAGDHEEALVAHDGRILDSMQYLLRKMIGPRLPERVILSLNAGNFRERRLEELKERALAFAVQVRQDGKTRALAALNPAERRFVHLALQGEKEIRSRSVGDGLFKKVLIYRPGANPGKGPRRRPSSRKRRGGGQGGRSSED